MDEIDLVTIKLAKKKDRTAFKRIYDFYAPFVWKIAYRTMHGDSEAAGDAVQDTFIRVHDSLHKFGGESGLSTWLYRIVFNVCLTALAKEKRTRTMQPLDENIPARTSIAETLDTKEQVSVILASISAEDRFLLTGREVLDLSYEELAQIAGKNAGALRTRLSRLKDQIRRNLKDQESFFP